MSFAKRLLWVPFILLAALLGAELLEAARITLKYSGIGGRTEERLVRLGTFTLFAGLATLWISRAVPEECDCDG